MAFSVDGRVLRQIQLVHLEASFGSKIDILTRHLLVRPRRPTAVLMPFQWIREQDNAKAIVFSQWSDGIAVMIVSDSEVLDVMQRSFELNKIGYVRFDRRHKKAEDAVKLFKTSKEIQVFMLHSQSQSCVPFI
jgi:SNF2 family DNA or RNA helicase